MDDEEDDIGCEYCLGGGKLDFGVCPECWAEWLDEIGDDDDL